MDQTWKSGFTSLQSRNSQPRFESNLFECGLVVTFESNPEDSQNKSTFLRVPYMNPASIDNPKPRNFPINLKNNKYLDRIDTSLIKIS
jgi:hypothetical protein